MIFTDSHACKSRAHCKSCRGSRQFRRLLGASYELPGGVVDFGCPRGLAIDGDATAEKPGDVPVRTAARPFRPGDLLAKMIRVVIGVDSKSCSRCGERARLMNTWWLEEFGAVPASPDRLAAYLKRHGRTVAGWLMTEARRDTIWVNPFAGMRAVRTTLREAVSR